MKKIIDFINEQEFTTREYLFCGLALFFLGVVLGITLSPKGNRMYGSNNGNNNTGHFNDDDCKCDCDEDCCCE